MSILDSFPHTCTLQRRTRTRGSSIGSGDTFVAFGTGIVCWRQQASDSQINEFGKLGQRVTNKIYFLTNPGLTEQDQITNLTDKDGNVLDDGTYDVLSRPHPDASAGLDVVWRVMCEYKTGSA